MGFSDMPWSKARALGQVKPVWLIGWWGHLSNGLFIFRDRIMERIKAIVVEDNNLMAELLCDLLEVNHPQITLLGRASTGSDAIKLIADQNPELVFLDVELPDCTAFELLDQLPAIAFKTIFITAHSDYAIKAFRFNALDYLVKPIKEEELQDAIQRYITIKNGSNLNLLSALDNLKAAKPEDQKLVLNTQDGFSQIPLGKITEIESDRNYSYIYLIDSTRKLSSKNLAYFEDILTDKGFFRCHRSFIVNRIHVASLKNEELLMKDGRLIPISRRRKSATKSWLTMQHT
jgi:two-component system LytT family response regulator